MGTGTKQVAVLQGQQIPTNELVLYDAAGAVVHHENTQEAFWEISALRSGGKDYLCLQLSDKLLIYP